MAQYQVPQFIEVEDKIFGPLTIKQFIYLAGGAGVSALFIFALPIPRFFGIVLSLPVAGLALALAFLRINDRPFIDTMEAAFSYFTKEKLYLWQKKDTLPTEQEKSEAVTGASYRDALPKVTQSRLKDLAWSLDVEERNENR